MSTADRRARFRELHARDRALRHAEPVGRRARRGCSPPCGFEALATTSAGFAWSLGKHDQTVTRDELVAHVADACRRDDAAAQRRQRALLPGRPGRCRRDRSAPRRGRRGRVLDRGLRPGSRRHRRARRRSARASPRPRAPPIAAEPLVLTGAGREPHPRRRRPRRHDRAPRRLPRRRGRLRLRAGPRRSRCRSRGSSTRSAAPVNVLALPSGPAIGELARSASAASRPGACSPALPTARWSQVRASLREEGTSRYGSAGLPREAACARVRLTPSSRRSSPESSRCRRAAPSPSPQPRPSARRGLPARGCGRATCRTRGQASASRA